MGLSRSDSRASSDNLIAQLMALCASERGEELLALEEVPLLSNSLQVLIKVTGFPFGDLDDGLWMSWPGTS